jgi:hypothetical protein
MGLGPVSIGLVRPNVISYGIYKKITCIDIHKLKKRA